ncbi:MAG: four helix bundle protein [Candidatus Brocadia sp.]|nr:four helix bundle protein [Candidatus Brocadia sp.]
MMSDNIRSYRDLEVWQKAMDVAVECYGITRVLPKNESYGMNSQLQRAVISIPANIAEGRGRQHRKEFLQHLSIAYGSLAEVETYLLLAERLNYINKDQLNRSLSKTAEVGRMINGLKKSLIKKTPPDP